MPAISQHSMRSGAAAGLLESVSRAGGRPGVVLASARLLPADLAEPDRLLDVQQMAVLFEAASREAGNDCLGLLHGAGFSMAAVGQLSYVVLNAPTVGTALRNLERYIGLYAPGTRVFQERLEGEVLLCLIIPGPEAHLRRQLVEMHASLSLVLMQTLIGPDWKPRRVSLEHARPQSSLEHRRIFGAPVEFGCPRNAMAIGLEVLDYPVVNADRTLLPIVEKHVRDVLSRKTDESRLVTAVRDAVAHALCDGQPCVAVIARQHAMSARTLQRRLGESGTTFRRIVEEVRRSLAFEYLDSGSTSLTQVAFLLGYSELSSFHHAFQRWAGIAPSEFRRRKRSTMHEP